MEVRIDFDEASREWMKNKVRIGQSYKYICSIDGCKRYCCKDENKLLTDRCIWHYMRWNADDDSS
jgi:hypothetical protein